VDLQCGWAKRTNVDLHLGNLKGDLPQASVSRQARAFSRPSNPYQFLEGWQDSLALERLNDPSFDPGRLPALFHNGRVLGR
jgi:hypothetical protein